MRLAWRHYHFTPDSGVARGYLTASYGLWTALKRRIGEDLVDAPNEGAHPKVHIHFCPPHMFRPLVGKLNLLFTMWEGLALPPEFAPYMRAAQAYVVPSRYCQIVWANHGMKAGVVHLGVDDAYLETPAERSVLALPASLQERPARTYLWVGSRIARKGWDRLLPAWHEAWRGRFGVAATLRIKTIGDGSVSEIEPGVTLDQRDLEPAEMLALYQQHDAFLSTSYGEGFGLPALEAMAAGCLAISPLVGGHADFMDAATALLIDQSGTARVEYGGPSFQVVIPTEHDIARALATAYDAWGTPGLEEVRRRGTMRARRMTWGAAADLMLDLLEKATGNGATDGFVRGWHPEAPGRAMERMMALAAQQEPERSGLGPIGLAPQQKTPLEALLERRPTPDDMMAREPGELLGLP